MSASDRVAADSSCRLVRTTKVPITLDDGRPVYVEPEAVVRSGNRLLVAGFPSYIWSRNGNTMQSRNTLFGVLVSPDGKAEEIPSPLPAGHLSDVRAIALGDGTWATAFADVAPETQFNRQTLPRTDAYWFGITNGRKWVVLEKLPNTNGTPQSMFASKLVRSREGYSIAIPVKMNSTRDGRPRVAVAVLTRNRDGWKRRDRAFEFVAAVSLDTTTTGNLLLAAFAIDTIGARLRNEFALYSSSESDMTWHEITRIEREPFQYVHEMGLSWSRDSLLVTWLEDDIRPNTIEARAIVGATQAASPRQVIVSTDALDVQAVGDAASPAWLAQERVDSTTSRIVLVQSGGLHSNSRTNIPNPFVGRLGAAALPNNLLVVGPVRSKDQNEPAVSLHLMTAQLSCSLAKSEQSGTGRPTTRREK